MPRPLSGRPLLALLILMLLAVSKIENGLMTLPFIDRGFLERHFQEAPDKYWSGYPDFLRGIAQHTRKGDRIALLVPARHWNDGYAYAYYRASYFLAGRQVIPVVQPDDTVVFGNLRDAGFVALWRMKAPGAPTIWQGNEGILVRR